MGNNTLETIKEKKRINIIVILIISIFVFGGRIIKTCRTCKSKGYIFELTNTDFIRIFIAILSMLGVLSCLLSYMSNKKEELFIMSLMYTMFFLDICISNALKLLISNYMKMMQ